MNCLHQHVNIQSNAMQTSEWVKQEPTSAYFFPLQMESKVTNLGFYAANYIKLVDINHTPTAWSLETGVKWDG